MELNGQSNRKTNKKQTENNLKCSHLLNTATPFTSIVSGNSNQKLIIVKYEIE